MIAAPLTLLLGLATAQADGLDAPDPPADLSRYQDLGLFRRGDEDFLDSEGFELYHPDMRFRRLGLQAQQQGDFGQAFKYYQRAARFADKLAQGAIAELYWNGQFGTVDRARGYVWMDLAAERGAPLLLAHRERYWRALSEAERAQVAAVGAALYAEYGDSVAKPRLERQLRWGRHQITGSHAGWVGPGLTLCIDPQLGGGCGEVVSGHRYYADRYWRAQPYWEWQDGLLRTPPRGEGKVEVGPVQPARTPSAIPQD